MKPSFVNLPKPFLVSVITDTDPAHAIATIRNSEFDGAQAYDLHLRSLERRYHNEDDLGRIIRSTHRLVMLINYRGDATWKNDATDEELVQSHLIGVRAGASACDLMGDLFDPSPLQLTKKPEAIDRQKRLIDQVHSMGAEVIMSAHTFGAHLPTEQAVEQLIEMQSRGADMVKLAELVNSEDELLESIRTTVELRRNLKVPFIHICMGQYGKLHRFVGAMFGSSLIFCVQKYQPGALMDQPLLHAAKAVLDKLDWHVDRMVE